VGKKKPEVWPAIASNCKGGLRKRVRGSVKRKNWGRRKVLGKRRALALIE